MDDELRARLEAIEARLEAIEERPPERATMKESRRCTSCGGAKLVHTAHLIADIQAGVPFGLSIKVPAWGRVKTRGVFEVFACTACGLVEWHVVDLETGILEDTRLTLIEPSQDDPSGPYR